MDLDLEAIQVIREDPHRVCIQTGANDRMDLVVIPLVIPVVIPVVAMQVIPDQTRVHRAISVGVVIPVVIQVVIPVVILVVIPAVIQVVIPAAIQVVGITMQVVEVVIIQEEVGI